MGSGIACHLANVGIDVLMLDIVPKNLEKVASRNMVADEFPRVVKSKPNPIYNKEFLKELKQEILMMILKRFHQQIGLLRL